MSWHGRIDGMLAHVWSVVLIMTVLVNKAASIDAVRRLFHFKIFKSLLG